MDCKKIKEKFYIYCDINYVSPSNLSSNTIALEDLNIKKDQMCLESMKMLEKYCKSENNSK